jgi:hypothetical protein
LFLAVKTRVVHDYRVAPGYYGKQGVFKPVLKKLFVGRLPVAFNGTMTPVSQGAGDVYPFKQVSRHGVFDVLPARGAGEFPLQTGVYAAFTDINTPVFRYPL